MAVGAVGALTAAVATGLSALQQQQQQEQQQQPGGTTTTTTTTAAAGGPADGLLLLAAPHRRSFASVSSSAGMGGFPLVLLPAPAPTKFASSSALEEEEQHDNDPPPPPPPAPQRLLATGTRSWGTGAWWDGRSLMRVRIYDFALYADEARLGAATAAPPRHPAPLLPDALAVSPALSDVPATILLRAARDIPLSRLAEEYERILRRRVAAAADDALPSSEHEPALRGLLDAFRDPSRLPASALRLAGAADEPSVVRGASLTFERLPGGRVLARCISPASGEDADVAASSSSSSSDIVTTLADVTSPTLCRALFGLYLADQPVSAKAKEEAGRSLGRMLMSSQGNRRPAARASSAAAAAASYRPRRGDRVVCGGGLEVSPLQVDDGQDACVLVPAFE
jgi:hypothetical protein